MAPRLFPVKKGFPQAAKAAEAAGLIVMPYISMLYWCERWQTADKTEPWPEFEEARPYACGGAPGDKAPNVEDGHYVVVVKNYRDVPMCRFTDFWAEYLAAQIKRLRAESGCTGIYLDMAGAAPRWPCFHREHGHPAGGGDHWARGDDKVLAAIREAAGPNVLISAEGRYEGYIPFVDMDLAADMQTIHREAAVYEAIHGERRMTFSDASPDQDPSAIVCQYGLHWLLGHRPRFGLWVFDEGYPEAFQFLRRLCRMRRFAGEFLDSGRLLRASAWTAAPGRMRCERWKQGRQGERATVVAMELPAVERSAWQLPDGRIGIAMANFDARPQDVGLDIGPYAGAGLSNIRLSDSEGETLNSSVQGNVVSIHMPPRDIRLCVLTPSGKKR